MLWSFKFTSFQVFEVHLLSNFPFLIIFPILSHRNYTETLFNPPWWKYTFNYYVITKWPKCGTPSRLVCTFSILINRLPRTLRTLHWLPSTLHNSKNVFPEHLLYSPAGIYLLKVNIRNTRLRCEMCSKLTIKTPEQYHWRRSGVFTVNFEHISYLVLVFLLLTLNMQLPAGSHVIKV